MCKNQRGLLRELHSGNEVMCLIFAGSIWTSSFYFLRYSLRNSLVSEQWESLFFFQWVFWADLWRQVKNCSERSAMHLLLTTARSAAMSSGKIWDWNSLLFFCTMYASKVQVEFGEHKQSMLSLKVEKYSSAWIPMEILEEGFKDEISCCLYVLGTPLQVVAGREVWREQLHQGPVSHESLGLLAKESCFCSAASQWKENCTQWKENCPLPAHQCNLSSWM